MKKLTLLAGILIFGLVLPAFVGGDFRLPPPEKIVLDNGLTVYYLRNSDLPLVNFRILVLGTGTAYEPAEEEGVADLTAQLLLKGTTEIDAEAVAETLDFMGANLEVRARDEFTEVSGECLTQYFPRLMEITGSCLLKPAFKEEEFIKERAKRIDGIKAAKDDPNEAVRLYFRKAYFGTHPLGHLAGGTETSLKKMGLQELTHFYLAHFRPDQVIAAVVGDVSREDLVSLLKKHFGIWRNPASAKPALSLPPLPKISAKKLVLVDKPDASQAYFILGSPGYPMGDAVTPAADVMNTLFGGRFTSWLSTELRIKRGLTYGAYSSFQPWRSGGLFTSASFTRNEKIGEMLDITFDLLKKAREQGFSAEEIESAHNYILGQFPPSLETNGRKAGAFTELAFYGLGFDYYTKLLKKIQDISPEAAREAALRLLPQEGYVLLVLGKESEISPLLKKFGTFQEKKISDPDF